MNTQVAFIMNVSSMRNNLRRAESETLVLRHCVRTTATKALSHEM